MLKSGLTSKNAHSLEVQQSVIRLPKAETDTLDCCERTTISVHEPTPGIARQELTWFRNKLAIEEDRRLSIEYVSHWRAYQEYLHAKLAVLLDRDSLPELTVDDVREIIHKAQYGDPMTKEQQGLYQRLGKKASQEAAPIFLANAIGLGDQVWERSRELGDIDVRDGMGGIISYELKILPSFSKFLNRLRMDEEINRLADKLGQSEYTALLFIPLSTVSAKEFAFLRQTFDRIGFPKERIVALHNRLLEISGHNSFKEEGCGSKRRLVMQPAIPKICPLFLAAAHLDRCPLETMEQLSPANKAFLDQVGISGLIQEIRFWREWPDSELKLRATD